MSGATMPDFEPLLLRGLSYSQARKAIADKRIAARRQHWCDLMIVNAWGRIMLDDGDEFLTWEPTSEDERATDWEMVARPADTVKGGGE